MENTSDRTNGFRARCSGGDPDRLAIQSTRQTTDFPFLHRRLLGLGGWREVGMTRNEMVVLRPYGAPPVVEIEGLGGPHGVLVVNFTQSVTRTLRNGQRLRRQLLPGESVVIQTEEWREPRRSDVVQAQV
jgi:hypothetical protein